MIVGRDYYEPQGVDPQVSGRSPAGSLPQRATPRVVLACGALGVLSGHGQLAPRGRCPRPVARLLREPAVAARGERSAIRQAVCMPCHRSGAPSRPAPALQTTVERVFAFLLKNKVPRQTEGEGAHSVAACSALPRPVGQQNAMQLGGWCPGHCSPAALPTPRCPATLCCGVLCSCAVQRCAAAPLPGCFPKRVNSHAPGAAAPPCRRHPAQLPVLLQLLLHLPSRAKLPGLRCRFRR